MASIPINNNLNTYINHSYIIQWNIRSLPARFPSLQYFLSNLKCSVVLLFETWLLPSHSLNISQF